MKPLVMALAATALAALSATGQTLTVRKAAFSQADLSWTAVAGADIYTIERRQYGSIGNDNYVAIASQTQTSFTDDKIAGMTTYQYRVRVNTPLSTSNEVVVGPPPVGFNNIVPVSQSFLDLQQDAADFANTFDVAMDENNDPTIAYHVRYAGLGELAHEIWFVRWDRANYRWTAPVLVTKTSDSSHFHRVLSLAYDSAAKAIGIAFEDTVAPDVKIFLSRDGGSTWGQKYSIPMKEDQAAKSPSLALRNGELHASFNRDFQGAYYLNGKIDSGTSTWVETAVPTLAGVDSVSVSASTSIALDGSGVPALAYWTSGPDYNSSLGYWRPGWPASTRVIDSNGQPSDFVDVRMRFFGNQPRVLANVARDPSLYYETDWVTKSDDGGQSWTNAAFIPRDGGNHSVDAPFDISFNSKGAGAVVFNRNGGQGDDVCFGPKLSLSGDLVNWQTCGLDGTNFDTAIGFSGSFGDIAVRYNPDDKLYVLWQETYTGQQYGPGILFWRQP